MQKRVLAIASGGGHFIQLMRLSPAWDGHKVSIATVDPSSRALVGDVPFFTFRDVSRADWWRIPAAALDIARILLRVRPQVIITTGALPGLIAATLARPFGVKSLWVDSIANSEVLSGSGGQAGRVCSQVVTQWPHLAAGKVEHWGSVL
ncbi:MAG: UDP-N-acetylglucosamine transferase subunit ALG14 [Sandarakinorhabdus sp.]|jgi:UDP-N-acetylglucosamine:LPS N-acetylglucosamine transferase|nr:UDP-N-acetylglucosamine transferase subunit ALG14 [Sandarakinorhabdus sp.]